MNTINHKIGIKLILNDEKNTLELFKPLFEWLSKQGFGKLTPTHFVADTQLSCMPKNPTEAAFARLQTEAAQEGFKLNCYCFNMIR